MVVESVFWKIEKTRSVASWIVNTPEVQASARNFVRDNPDAPIIYRAWVKAEGMQKVKTPEGIEVLDLELHFGQLSEVLHTLRID
jgi:hypothetical protein